MSGYSPYRDPDPNSDRRSDRRYIARLIIRLAIFSGLISLLLTLSTRPLPVIVLGSGSAVAPVILVILTVMFVSFTLRFSTRRTSERYLARRQAREEARQQVRETLREFRDDFRAVRAARQAREIPEPEKHKNAAPGMDMYSVIDRMMDELDDDEIAYLQQRLQDRASGEDVDLPQTIGDLLDKRAGHRLGE